MLINKTNDFVKLQNLLGLKKNTIGNYKKKLTMLINKTNDFVKLQNLLGLKKKIPSEIIKKN